MLLPTETLETLGAKLLRVAVVLASATIITFLFRRLTHRLEKSLVELAAKQSGGADTENAKRIATASSVIRKVVLVLLWAAAAVMVLDEAGFRIGPLLAGAGIAGLAVSFGAQNLVRDVISGFFLLIENQIRVNDIAVINGTSGLVEEINLRTTVLRSPDGAVHIFPNGAITTLSNLTREFSYCLLDFSVAYKEDIDRVVDILRGVIDQLQSEAPYKEWILEPVEVFGVERFTESSVVVRARVKTAPGKQFQVGREANRRIKKAFDEQGIEIPFPHRSLDFGAADKPLRVALEFADREQLKALIREVLQEEAQRRPS